MSDEEYVNEITWNDYKAGDSLTGILVDSLSNMGRYGNNLYKLQNDDGFYRVWGNFKLDELMKKNKVSIGMTIRITYNGLVRTGNGHDMKDFTVLVLD